MITDVILGCCSEEHPQNVFVAMRNILTLVLEEIEEIPEPMLEIVLKNLLKQNKVSERPYCIYIVSLQRRGQSELSLLIQGVARFLCKVLV